MSPAAAAPARFELRGLVEGRLPPLPGSAERLRELERRAREAGFQLELEIDGGRFGFLARGGARGFDAREERPAEALEAWLRELLSSLPEGERAELSSTLRAELIEGRERSELLFSLEPRRGLVCLERSSPAPEPAPRPRRPRWTKGAQGAAILALAVLFVLWQPLWPPAVRAPGERLGGFRSEPIGAAANGVPANGVPANGASAAPGRGQAGSQLPFPLEAGDFAGVLELRAFGLEGRPVRLWLELAPVLAGDRAAWLAAPAMADRRQELARGALIAGSAQLRWFDASGRLLERRALPLEALWSGQAMRLSLPWPAGLRQAGVALQLGL
jgi:hypothetical protein